jgi:hypothetical protein
MRRQEVMADLYKIYGEIESLQTQLALLSQKTQHLASKIEQECGNKLKTDEILIYRREQEKIKRIPSTPDSEIRPGDVIQVSLPIQSADADCAPPPAPARHR